MIKRLMVVLGVIFGIIIYSYLCYWGGYLWHMAECIPGGHDFTIANAVMLGTFIYPIATCLIALVGWGVYEIAAWIIAGKIDPTLQSNEENNDLEQAKRELDEEFPGMIG